MDEVTANVATTALPALNTVTDCSSYNITVAPFLPQLYSLPSRVLENFASLDGLRQVYVETNPFIFGLGLSLALSLVFFLVAEINRNWSQVDRAWSVLPNFYVLHFVLWARLADEPSARVEFLVSATMIWSARLTFNYARKGGYTVGSEDYRWAIVRRQVPAFIFTIFSFVFIAVIQNVLIYMFAAAPTYILLLTCRFDNDISAFDWVYCSIILLLVVMEFVSDGQQWEFQEAKRRYQKDAKVPRDTVFTQADLDRGFITSGMWAYSRHPNFAAEQLIWFTLYQWSCNASATMHSWSVSGSLALIMLFQGSTWLTELISAGKYPDYKHYQEKVGMFMPGSFIAYEPETPKQPKVIRTSELAKKQAEKEKNAKKAGKA